MSEFKFGPNQEKWLQELESGNNLQCKKSLTRFDSDCRHYCCLGLAADKVLKLKRVDESDSTSYFIFNKYRLFAYLSGESYYELGLFSPQGDIMMNGEMKTLSQMNDSGLTFKEIAQFIRNNPEKVFSHSV